MLLILGVWIAYVLTNDDAEAKPKLLKLAKIFTILYGIVWTIAILVTVIVLIKFQII